MKLWVFPKSGCNFCAISNYHRLSFPTLETTSWTFCRKNLPFLSLCNFLPGSRTQQTHRLLTQEPYFEHLCFTQHVLAMRRHLLSHIVPLILGFRLSLLSWIAFRLIMELYLIRIHEKLLPFAFLILELFCLLRVPLRFTIDKAGCKKAPKFQLYIDLKWILMTSSSAFSRTHLLQIRI